MFLSNDHLISYFYPMRVFLFTLILMLCRTLAAFSQVTAGFSTVSSTCTNTPVAVHNTSTNATTYFWSFCAADFNSTPEAVNLGNPSNVFFSQPVFCSFAQDADGNFYGLVTEYDPGRVVRLNFGNSLLNTPTAVELGNFGGAIPNQCEGLQLLKVNNKWIAIIVGGSGLEPNSDPRVVKLDFGSSLANTPTATNWGNIGGLALPHDLFVGQDGGNYYGFAVNVFGNTLTRLNFGPDFSTTPTGVNMGNIGGLSYPSGLTFVNFNSSWYCFIADQNSNSLTRLSFGSSLQNTPTGVNIGNPGGLLNAPRDVSLFVACDGVYGFVTNYVTNAVTKLNFGTDPTSSPAATDLGNIGSLNFPHSISDFFRVGNDIYAFIPNATGESLTRIRFAGCSDIPGSTAKDNLSVSYPNPGTYNINLLVDLGLPTQTSYCQQIVVKAQPEGQFEGDTVCYGTAPSLVFKGKGAPPFSIEFTDGNGVYNGNEPATQSTVILPYQLPATGSTSWTLVKITDAGGCSTSVSPSAIGANTTLMIDPLPQGGISGLSTVCGDDTTVVSFQPDGGSLPYEVQLSNGATVSTFSDVVGSVNLTVPLLPGPTTFSLLKLTDKFGCSRSSAFDKPSFTTTPLPAPAVVFKSLDPICISNDPVAITAASETKGVIGSGVYSGPGIDADGNFSSARAGVGVHTIKYTYTASDGCVDADSSLIVVNPLPVITGPSLITACGGIPVQLTISGGKSYLWSPAAGLDHPDVANPIITVDTTTTYYVAATDSNGCVAADTITIKAAVSASTAFVLPNAFTPNGDGVNDCFGIRRWGDVVVEQFAVYNRWGGCVFTTGNPSDCWDGRYRGQPMPADTYVYVIRARTACGEITRKGTLVLVR